MVIGHNAQLPPAIHHRQQTQMIIRRLLRRHLAQRKAIEHLIIKQELGLAQAADEHRIASSFDAPRQFLSVPAQHELEQLGNRLRVLLDLLLGGGIQDGQARVHVPLVRVDAQRDIDLDVLDAADVTADFPGELVVGAPCGAHAQEGGVRDGLRVGGDLVVERGGEVDVLGAEAGEDVLDEGEALV